MNRRAFLAALTMAALARIELIRDANADYGLEVIQGRHFQDEEIVVGDAPRLFYNCTFHQCTFKEVGSASYTANFCAFEGPIRTITEHGSIKSGLCGRALVTEHQPRNRLLRVRVRT